MFHLRKKGELLVLQTDLFPASLPHAFATRRLATKAGSRGASEADFRIDSLPQTARWWRALRDSIFSPNHVMAAHTQVHGGMVRVVDPDNPGGEEREVEGFGFRLLGEGDGLIKPFSRKPIFLAITTADCLPCLVYDSQSGAVGVVHAGWRGLAADIPAAAVKGFTRELGSSPRDLCWAVGPSIDADHYEVGTEVIAALETAGYAESDWKYSPDVRPGWTGGRRRDRYLLNLAACLTMRLESLGVAPERIDICALSTYGNPASFFSYRRDGGVVGLQASVIG